MFERFTERARQVVVLAQEEARTLRHDYLGTEHLLLGLLRVEDGVAARVLASFEVGIEETRAQVMRMTGTGDDTPAGQIPFTKDAKKTLERSLREAIELGHDYIGTEHVLLGLARVNEGVVARILLDHDVDEARIRKETLALLPVRARPWPPGRRTRRQPPFDLAGLRAAVQHATEGLIQAQHVERAEHLREKQRRLEQLVTEIEADLRSLEPPPSPGAPAAAAREYDVKTLEGGSETWAQQLAAWRRDGWQVLSIVSEGAHHRAVLERRA